MGRDGHGDGGVRQLGQDVEELSDHAGVDLPLLARPMHDADALGPPPSTLSDMPLMKKNAKPPPMATMMTTATITATTGNVRLPAAGVSTGRVACAGATQRVAAPLGCGAPPIGCPSAESGLPHAWQKF